MVKYLQHKKFQLLYPKEKYQKLISLFLMFSLFTQAMIPLGFMPGDLSSGESFVTVCPGQQPILHKIINNSAQKNHHKHSHEKHAHHDNQATNICLWAVGMLEDQTLTVESLPKSIPARPYSNPYNYAYLTTSNSPRLYAIRAPPTLIS